MFDIIITGGRLNVGLGRGVPRDDLKHGLDRDTAQARFEEGIEILTRAWTGKTFNFSGKAWNYVDITCRPRPLQRPHPPIYYGAISPDSPAMVVRRGWYLALSRQPLANCARAMQSYRNERAKLGNLNRNGDAIMVRNIPAERGGTSKKHPSASRGAYQLRFNRWPRPRPIEQGEFGRAFQGVLRVLKIRPRPFYNVRHTFISVALAIGCNQKWIAEQTGASIAMIQDHYGRCIRGGGDALLRAHVEQPKLDAIEAKTGTFS